ncbi:Aquaporin-8 [Balamuthia mandrillaris]
MKLRTAWMAFPGALDKACAAVGPFLTELVGAFMFMLTIGLSVLSGGELAPLAIGLSLMILVYCGGHISGGHFNPSVSLGVFLTDRGKLSFIRLVGYWVAQFLGGFLGALTYWGMTYRTFPLRPGAGFNAGQAFAAELFFSFLLIHAVLQTATTKTQAGNSFFGLAIGLSVTAGGVAVGQHMPISGGGFNPAVTTGAIIVNAIAEGGERFEYIWVYWSGPFVASFVAALLFRVTNRVEFKRGYEDPDEQEDASLRPKRKKRWRNKVEREEQQDSGSSFADDQL